MNLPQKYFPWIFNSVFMILILIVICETTAISCIKRYHNNLGSHYFLFAVMFYAMVCYLLHCSFYLKNSMGLVNVAWSGMSVFAVAIIGILFFKEKIHYHDIFAGTLITIGMMIFKYTD
jgi:multidrug transporter EmrE-like cation transporter